MKALSRHKMFVKDLRNFRLTDTQATKLFLYVANLLNDEPLPELHEKPRPSGRGGIARRTKFA